MDPLSEQDRLRKFNASGAETYAAELIHVVSSPSDDTLIVTVQIGRDGIALRDAGTHDVLRAFDLDTLVSWSKSDNDFYFTFSDDMETMKKVRLRTNQGAEMVGCLTRAAAGEMESMRDEEPREIYDPNFSAV